MQFLCNHARKFPECSGTQRTVPSVTSRTNGLNFHRFGNLVEADSRSAPRTENHGLVGSIPPWAPIFPAITAYLLSAARACNSNLITLPANAVRAWRPLSNWLRVRGVLVLSLRGGRSSAKGYDQTRFPRPPRFSACPVTGPARVRSRSPPSAVTIQHGIQHGQSPTPRCAPASRCCKPNMHTDTVSGEQARRWGGHLAQGLGLPLITIPAVLGQKCGPAGAQRRGSGVHDMCTPNHVWRRFLAKLLILLVEPSGIEPLTS